jgi:predicted Ser/Thr protein kinase
VVIAIKINHFDTCFERVLYILDNNVISIAKWHIIDYYSDHCSTNKGAKNNVSKVPENLKNIALNKEIFLKKNKRY